MGRLSSWLESKLWSIGEKSIQSLWKVLRKNWQSVSIFISGWIIGIISLTLLFIFYPPSTEWAIRFQTNIKSQLSIHLEGEDVCTEREYERGLRHNIRIDDKRDNKYILRINSFNLQPNTVYAQSVEIESPDGFKKNEGWEYPDFNPKERTSKCTHMHLLYNHQESIL